MTDRLALSWSGGKDSALTLWALRRDGHEPAALVTTVTETYDRISMHGVRRTLLARQAEAARIPLVEVLIPPACSNDVYEQRLEQAFASEPLAGIDTVAYGDLFLEDIRAYRQRLLDGSELEPLFPLWHQPTRELLDAMLTAGLRATIVCLDPAQLDRRFAGRTLDRALAAELPGGVDPCGERGEFHTFVTAGPMLSGTVAVQLGDMVERDGFVYADLKAVTANG